MSDVKILQLSDNCFVTVYRDGRVRGDRKFLSPCPDSHGYLQVHTRAGLRQVHRLVALAFCPNPKGLETVDHIDGNPLNNHADNLQWLSNRDNIRKSQAKPVIGGLGGFGTYYPAISDVKMDGHCPSAVTKACKGNLKTHHDLIWSYA